MEQFSEETLDDIPDMVDFSEEIKGMLEDVNDMLEEIGLDELLDSPVSGKGDMDPADIKAMKIKHRNKEMKDIVPSTPARISEKIDITFFVGDAIANKLYESCTVSVAGIGTNENKVFISAFQKLNAKQTTVLSMLSKARADIAAYFTKHCDEILTKARTEAGTGNYQKAIFLLTSVPNVCEECYTKCQQQAVAYCRQQMAAETADLLNQAKTEWMKNPTAEGATIVADIIGKANPQSSNYSDHVGYNQNRRPR